MVTKEMLERYFAGLATEVELKLVADYLSDPQNDATLLREVMEDFDGDTLPAIGYRGERERLLHQLRSKLYPAVPKEEKRHAWRISLKRIALAASVLLAVGSFCFIMLMNNSNSIQADAALLAWNIIENNGMQVQHHVLNDKTEVWLKPRSVLRYQAGLASLPQRIIQLEGECFFDVAHKDDTAFVVQAKGTYTKVLGTAFNIEAYAAEQLFRVSLVRGSVQVSEPAQEDQKGIILSAGHQLFHHAAEKVWRKDTLRMQDAAQFRDGRMVFNNIPLRDALRRIADRYGYELKFHPATDASRKTINGVYNGETLEQLLQLVLFIPKYNYTIHQNLIEIHP